MSDGYPSQAVDLFLKSEFDKKTEPLIKKLEKALASDDYDNVSKLKADIGNFETKYQKKNWLLEATGVMAPQLKFGTHISKGVHPSSGGDNINIRKDAKLPQGLVGTCSLRSNAIDANGNAAALPLASFFDFTVHDESSDSYVSIRELVLNDNEDFIGSLSVDESIATEFHSTLKSALLNEVSSPTTDGFNKQTLWPNRDYSDNGCVGIDYQLLVPLYPSLFTHVLFNTINVLRYSDENKEARDNRFKKNVEHKPYVSMFDLATLQLGGTKPQNISRLMSSQGGRNYLLPSMPPIVQHDKSKRLSLFSKSLFDNKHLQYRSKKEFMKIFEVVRHDGSTLSIRNTRKDAIGCLLQVLFSIAEDIREHQEPGWSIESHLDLTEQYWLDPKRADMSGQEDFREARLATDWTQDIVARIARWMTSVIKAEFKHSKHLFGDAVYAEWEREIESTVSRYERAGKGVFL